MPNDLRRAEFIPYFDGLRAFGAMIVFFNHMGMSHLLPLGAPTPIGFLTNGAFAVDVFFALSGYVMSAVAKRSRETLLAISIRRYLRLAIPSAASCLLSVALLSTGLYYNRSLGTLNGSEWLLAWFGFEPSFSVALREAAVGIFAAPDSAYNSSLWTLYYELWYSIAIFVGAYLGRLWWVSLLFAAALTCYFAGLSNFGAPACFAAGAFAFHLDGFLHGHTTPRSKRRSPLSTAMATFAIVVAFYVATYPRFPAGGTFTLYAWLPASVVDVAAPAVAGSVIVGTIGMSPFFAKLFSVRPMLFLGRHSFSIYLLHLPIICSVGSWLGVILYPSLGTSSRVVLKFELGLIFVVVALTVLFIAMAYNQLVDLPAIRLGRWVSKVLDRHLSPLEEAVLPGRSLLRSLRTRDDGV